MKTLNLLLTTGVLLVSSFIISVNAQTQSVSLDPEEWSEGKNMDIYEEEGNLVLEVWKNTLISVLRPKGMKAHNGMLK